MDSKFRKKVKFQRKCIGCAKTIDKSLLIKVVFHKLDGFVVDYEQKIPGRSVYLHHSVDCIQSAVKSSKKILRKFSKLSDSPLSTIQFQQSLHKVECDLSTNSVVWEGVE